MTLGFYNYNMSLAVYTFQPWFSDEKAMGIDDVLCPVDGNCSNSANIR
jgi:hypothetical protein